MATTHRSMNRAAGVAALGTVIVLTSVLAGCRVRPTAPPIAPTPPSATPPDVGGAAAGTADAPDPADSATPLPTPTPLLPIVGTRTVPPGASSTPTAAFPNAAILIGKRLEGGAIGSIFHLDDVRTGEHPGYTRIVWAMDEEAGAPRWTTLLRRDVEGTAVIDVALYDVSAFAKPETLDAQSPQSPIVDSIRQQRVADDAELRFAVRLARPAGYRVTVIDGPVRVVLDVAHDP
ncbi:MAG: hypothetical protein IT332_09680 [Ardenticatenales bacterium]|nr:hypothetical protein [Ardenticatenales bacterium]